MSHLIWLTIYAVTFGAMVLIGRKDRRLAKQEALCYAASLKSLREGYRELQRTKNRLVDAVERADKKALECTEQASRLKAVLSEIHASAAAAIGPEDWSRPLTVGDPDRDPLYVEISLCGPDGVAVYAMHHGFREIVSVPYSYRKSCNGIVVYEGTRVILGTLGRGRRGCSSGIAQSADVQKITDAVRRYNESFHQSKGGEDAGAVKEEERTDRDPQRHHDQGGRDPRGQGTPRRRSAERSAGPSA